MKVVQCKKGHYYDAEKYDECPMCKKNIVQKNVDKNNSDFDNRSSTFGIQQNKVDLSQLEECKEATTITSDDRMNERINIHSGSQSVENNYSRPNDGETLVNFSESNLKNEPNALVEDKPIRPDDSGETQIEFGSYFQQKPSENSLQQNTVQQQKPARPDDNGETQVGFGDFKIDSFVQTSPPSAGTRKNNGPVVGWLVAIKGPHIGQSFELFPKKNFIGRNDSLIVNLYNDKTVSRTAPLSVIFNRHNNKFMAMSGNSDQTAYINDDLLLQPIELKENDQIDIGNTRLLFVPLLKNGESVESIYKVD